MMKNLTLLIFLIAVFCCSLTLLPGEQTKTLKSPFVETFISDEQESLLPSLFKAALAADEKQVSELIKNGSDVNEKVESQKPVFLSLDHGKGVYDKIDVSGWTALHMVSFLRKGDIASTLIEANADVNVKNSKGRTPIGVVFLTNLGSTLCLSHEEMIALLIKKGAKVDIEDNDGKAPLDYAVERGSSKAAKIMIDAGAKHNLFSAIMLGDEKAVSKFLEDGADPNAALSNSLTPLHYAARYNRMGIAKLLISKGAKVNALSKRKETPFFIVASFCIPNVEMLKLLIENGADVNMQDEDGRTPLEQVISLCRKQYHAEVAKLLISNGAKVNVKDTSNATPLIKASRDGLDDVVGILLENGAEVDSMSTSFYEGTSLMCAARYGNVKTIEVLLKFKANVNLINRDGKTALDLADTDEKKTLLKAHGAKTGAELEAEKQK